MRRTFTKFLAVVVLAMATAGTAGCNDSDPAESPSNDGNRGTSAGRPGPGQ